MDIEYVFIHARRRQRSFSYDTHAAFLPSAEESIFILVYCGWACKLTRAGFSFRPRDWPLTSTHTTLMGNGESYFSTHTPTCALLIYLNVVTGFMPARSA
jgi:hypothetical protein